MSADNLIPRLRRVGNWLRGSFGSEDARKGLFRAFGGPHKSQSGRFLFVAFFDPAGLKTIVENIVEWCGQSRYRFDLVNLFDFPGRNGLAIPGWCRLDDYAGVVVHCTVAFNADNLSSLDRRLATPLSAYQGLKILMKQDEHYRPAHVADFVKSRRFDLLITLTEPDHVREIYPAERVGNIEFMFAKTAYFSTQLRHLDPPALADRNLDVGYRGSIQPWNFGTLAYEKQEIGDRFTALCEEYGLSHDISSRWEDRFLGERWIAFLCGIKATLGAESGGSIVDFDGEVERKCKNYRKAHPAAPFSEVHAQVLAPYEDNAYYRAISPRHLEAAACKTTQVLYEGRYSGMFEPGRHYIPLRRDFANAAEVVARLRDIPFCQALVDRAHEQIVLNPCYSYDAFVAEFDQRVAQLLATKAGGR